MLSTYQRLDILIKRKTHILKELFIWLFLRRQPGLLTIKARKVVALLSLNRAIMIFSLLYIVWEFFQTKPRILQRPSLVIFVYCTLRYVHRPGMYRASKNKMRS